MADNSTGRRERGTLSLFVGGDIGPIQQPVDRLADLILPALDDVDFRVAQCERLYASSGGRALAMGTPAAGGKHTRLSIDHASIFRTAKIDVVSMASNWALAWGPQALLDTNELFRSMGIQVIGAGKDEEEARKPAILEKDGVKVAVFAYCSVLRETDVAAPGLVGLAPLRAKTWYQFVDFQPGYPPIVHSAPIEPDLEAMQEDIRKAKEWADGIVVIMHWGLPNLPKVLCGYQRPMAHAAIDAGADVVLGHHSHLLHAVETYKHGVCFYDIGNFLSTGTLRQHPGARWNLFWHETIRKTNPDALYDFSRDAQMAILAKLSFAKGAGRRVAFVPIFINPQAQPEVLGEDDPRFKQVVDYVEWASDFVPHAFRQEGQEIVVEATG